MTGRDRGLDKRLERLERRLAPTQPPPIVPPHMVAALDEIAAAKSGPREPEEWALRAVEPLRRGEEQQ